jgi:hypothetical protein
LRWWAIAPILCRATRQAGGSYEPVDVLREAFAGATGIWVIEDENDDIVAVATAGVRQFPRQKVLQISFVAGRGLESWWQTYVAEMDKVARAAGATKIYAYGRRGWVRFWKARGVAQHVTSEMLVRTL